MGYRTSAKGRGAIRKLAIEWKKQLGLEKSLYLPVVQIYEILPMIYPGLTTDIVDDNEFPKGKFAETEIETKTIRLSRSVYDGACEGKGFERMTIMHEVGHFEMLANSPVKLYREVNRPVAAFEDPEWQAKCFAGEAMIDKELVRNMEPREIALQCGVSMQAAVYQWNQYQKEKRQDKIPSFKMFT